MKRILLSTILIVIGLSAFSQSPSRSICLRPAYPLVIGETTVDGLSYDNNGLYMYDILQDSLPQYEIGHIFAQTVRFVEDGIGFYVKADSLHSFNVVYGIEVDSPPHGNIEFNEATGRFKYYPAAEDYKSFTITFTATNGTESVSENVKFNLMPQTVPEEFAFQTQGVLPSASDYTLIAETSKSLFLNNENRTAFSYSISGKDVVFDDNVKNKNWGLNGREDIYELNIFAERLIIRSALNFPQTNITVYAKEIIFEDHDTVFASINTTPSSINTLAAGESRLNGANAGDVTLYVKSFKGNTAKRLVLNGARGQNSSREGAPGNGGNGGTVTSTINISSYCDFARGGCGVRYDADSVAADKKGQIIASGRMGTDGHFEFIDNPHAYIHPYYISAVIRHANDAFINNYPELALQVCSEYRSLVDEYMNSPEWESCGDEEEIKLKNDLTEIDDMLSRLNQGLDYFGNPVGWVPLLSFEILLENYQTEVDRAIPTLYMYYWLNRIDQTLQKKVKASQFGISKAVQEIHDYQEFLNDVTLDLPIIKDRAEEIALEMDELRKEMETLKAYLLSKAKKNVKKKNRIKNAVSICQNVISCIPVYGTAINTAVNVASNVAYATGALTNLAGGNDMGFTSVFDNVGKVNYENMINEIKNAYNSFSLDTIGKNASFLKDTYKSIDDAMKPLTTSFNNINKLLSTSSTPIDQVNTELDRLLAESIEFQAMKARLKELNNRKTELDQKLKDTKNDIMSTVTKLSDKVIALDDLRRDAFTNNSKRDLNAMQYLDKMNQEAKARLQKYHYYLRKAYEYRLLKPYKGEFNLVGMYEAFEEFAENGTEATLASDDYKSLASTFKSEISKIAEVIIDEYNKMGISERSSSVPVEIPKATLNLLNTNKTVPINIYDMGIFASDEENIRLIDFDIKYIKTHSEGNVPTSSYMDLTITHSGISKFRKNGQVYWFNHMSSSDTNPHTWEARYFPKTQECKEIKPSAANLSLLSSILDNNTDNIMFFSRPSVWSDITMTKNYSGPEVIIDSLVLEVTYDFTRRTSQLRNVDIMASENLLPYIACSVEDVSGRSNGNGNLHRSYSKNGQPVTFTAIEQYGTYHFVNWTDRGGKVVSDKLDLTVNRSTDQFYIANYERRVPILNVPDTIKVGYSGGVNTVNVGNVGSGDIEMDWYVSDSLSTWVHLNGDTEGVDNGSFIFEFEANESGVNRLDSLEIFAPETDIMSKMIYIAQVNDGSQNIRQVEASGNEVFASFNSNSGYVKIEGNGIMSVRLFSMEGREMSNYGFKGENSVTFDINGIPRGVYLLAIKTKNGQVCKKILLTN